MSNVTLAATKGHVGFDEANQALDQQLSEELLVSSGVLGHLIVHLNLSIVL